MKNIVLSAVAVLAMSSFAVAGGDIAPVEEPVVVVEPVMDDSGFYLGLAYGMGNLDWTESWEEGYSDDFDFNTVMLQAGYNFNKYIAVEGRYWFGLDTSNTVDEENFDLNVDAWGLYVKPQYPVTESFNIYALLGYASIESAEFSDGSDSVDVVDEYDQYNGNFDGFSWGVGAAYSFTENVQFFVDYVSILDDTVASEGSDKLDWDVSVWNFGVTYKF